MFSWPWQKVSRQDIDREREETRKERGALAHALLSLDRERHALDLMVKRSLELLEGKK